ncbi:phage tail spike protein [Facklamia sp. P9177]|uniref:phage tail spike protein n=1 Tax=Facklamia sp. P9177 TaxID=3421945 RepID=UPI003D1660EF
MISVFNKSAITNKELAGVGRPILDNWAKEATYHSTLNGEQFIKILIPHRSKKVDKSKLPNELDILKITDMNDEEDYFRIRKIKVTLRNYEIYAEHITYDLIDNFIEDINIVGLTGQTAMDHISMNTQYPHRFKLFSDINKQANIRIVRKNPMQAIIGNDDNTFINRFGGELKRLRFTLSMNKRIGKNLKDSIRSRKNLTGFEREIDIDNVATRILPKGPNGISLPEKYVDSPLISNYPHPMIKEIEVKSEFEGDFEKLSDQEKQRIYSEMRQACHKAFESGIDKPKATYKVNFVTLNMTEEYKDYRSLESVNLGDTIEVYEEEFDLFVKARVVSIEYDLLNCRYKEITLGVYQGSLVRNQINTANNLAFKFDEVNKTAVTALKSANGKNTNYYSDDEPQNPDEGDLWFKSNGSVWQYEMVDGKLDWVEKTINKEKFESQFKLIESKTKELLQDIRNAEKRANQAIADAGLETLGKANKKAQEIALQKYQEAVNEAKRLDLIVSADVEQKKAEAIARAQELDGLMEKALKSYSDKTITETIDSLKVDYIDVTLDEYVKQSTYETGIDGIQASISEIKTDPLNNIKGWDDLASKSFVSTQIDVGSKGIKADIQEIKGDKYKQALIEASASYTKSQYIDTMLKGYVKAATYEKGINGINTNISSIKTNPSKNINGWDDLANKSFVSTTFNAEAGKVKAELKNYVDGSTYKNTVIKATVDSINQTISQVSEGKVAGINQLTNTVKSMEQIISTPDSTARYLMTSNIFQHEISNPKLEIHKNIAHENIMEGWGFKFRPDGDGKAYFISKNNNHYTIAIEVESEKPYSISFDNKHYLNNHLMYCFTSSGLNEYLPLNLIASHTSPSKIENIIIPQFQKYLYIVFLSTVPKNFVKMAKMQIEQNSTATDYFPPLSENTAFKSAFTQQQDSIDFALFGQAGAISRINLGEKGLYFKGDQIRLDGTTVMDDAFANNIFTKNLTTDSLKANKAVIAEAIVDSLNVNRMTGYSATWVQNVFDGIKSKLKITGDGVSVVDNLGRSSTYFDDDGIDFFEKGIKLGSLEYVTNVSDGGALYGKNGISFRPEKNSYFGISYFPRNSRSSIRALAVDGTNGNTYLVNTIFGDERATHGFEIGEGSVSGIKGVTILNPNGYAGLLITGSGVYVTDGRSSPWRKL